MFFSMDCRGPFGNGDGWEDEAGRETRESRGESRGFYALGV